MKRLLNIIFFTSLIFYGLSFLIFVLRMMWFPPTMMGMMMGRQMMYNHMLYWFFQTFFISIMIVGIIILVWVVKEVRKSKKS
ncbi:MAG: hypothetical protein Q8935_07475 [Bacillota bacterium]|nr:hypothetical protein [Bacillota bacterium]